MTDSVFLVVDSDADDLAKFAGAHQSFEVARGGADEPRAGTCWPVDLIEMYGLFAQRFDQLYLQPDWQIADFVQQQRAAACGMDGP